MRVVWAKPATDDIVRIKEYLTDRSPTNAKKVLRLVTDAVKVLGDQPYIGRPGHVADTRELVISGLPYVVVYGVIETKSPPEIAIYHVYHGAQNWQVHMETEFTATPGENSLR